jgi:hypothetical protein
LVWSKAPKAAANIASPSGVGDLGRPTDGLDLVDGISVEAIGQAARPRADRSGGGAVDALPRSSADEPAAGVLMLHQRSM